MGTISNSKSKKSTSLSSRLYAISFFKKFSFYALQRIISFFLTTSIFISIHQSSYEIGLNIYLPFALLGMIMVLWKNYNALAVGSLTLLSTKEKINRYKKHTSEIGLLRILITMISTYVIYQSGFSALFCLISSIYLFLLSLEFDTLYAIRNKNIQSVKYLTLGALITFVVLNQKIIKIDAEYFIFFYFGPLVLHHIFMAFAEKVNVLNAIFKKSSFNKFLTLSIDPLLFNLPLFFLTFEDSLDYSVLHRVFSASILFLPFIYVVNESISDAVRIKPHVTLMLLSSVAFVPTSLLYVYLQAIMGFESNLINLSFFIVLNILALSYFYFLSWVKQGFAIRPSKIFFNIFLLAVYMLALIFLKVGIYIGLFISFLFIIIILINTKKISS